MGFLSKESSLAEITDQMTVRPFQAVSPHYTRTPVIEHLGRPRLERGSEGRILRC